MDIPDSWRDLCTSYESEVLIRECMDQLDKLTDYSPIRADVFRCFQFFSPADLRVIIIGQDPYKPIRGTIRANGLSFSCVNCTIPDSLMNIYSAIRRSDLGNVFNSGDLTAWARQGILLLNTMLTVPNTGKKKHDFWKPFVYNLIRNISANIDHDIFICLWGSYAKGIKKYISDRRNIKILEYTHPSPLIDNRLSDDRKFVNCPHFHMISGVFNINWNII